MGSMEKSVTPDAISILYSNPSPDTSSDMPEIVVQVLDLKPTGNRYTFSASDGKRKVKAIFPPALTSEIVSGKIQNLGLIRVVDYTLNDIPSKSEKYMLVTKCEVVASALEAEIKSERKAKEAGLLLEPQQEFGQPTNEMLKESAGISLKPKQEFIHKSADQIMHEQRANAAPAARMAMTRRVHPVVSLNPYQGNWTVKVRVTNKGTMRTYRNARGEGCVFNVELTDEAGTQIRATMFNEAARKFFEKFQLGKVYYISKGTLKVANKQFKTVPNDYEMTLNENAEVEEACDEKVFIPKTVFNFVPIDELGPYVNQKELVDIIGVVQGVSPTISVRRKSNNEIIPKRDIVVADQSKKTVVLSLWNELATTVGQELLDLADECPVVAFKSLKVGDFQGVSLSTVIRSTLVINPDIPEAKQLKSWYESEGKETAMASIGSDISPLSKAGARSMYADRVCLSHIIGNPSLGEEKPVYFSTRAYISFIRPDQTMWYKACKTCNKKVTEAIDSGYWCEGCQKTNQDCSLRYIMVVKVSDSTGEAWFSTFNAEAETIMGCSASSLDELKSQIGEENEYSTKLKEATWKPYLFRVSVAQHEYNNEKRQRITVRAVAPVDFATETRYLLDEISKNSQ